MVNRLPTWCRDAVLLGADAPFPIERPFTAVYADSVGVGARLRRRLVETGLLRPVLRGVFVATQVQDSLRLRVSAVRLVVPEHVVAVDRLAAWVHGVDALPRTAIHEMPTLDVFSQAGSRMRRDSIRSGVRTLTARDVCTIDGLRVTTPLRTACDLGRSLWRYDALAAIDGFLRHGVDPAQLLSESERFKGHRGVVQLRRMVALGDPGAESPPESALRLHWHEAGLPWPETQIWVYDGDVPRYRIDLGDEQTRYGAEYFGEEFHDEDQREHDEGRITWLETERDWVMDVFVKQHVYGLDPASLRLRQGFERARRHLGLRGTAYIDLGR
ncbi:hypothetical protein [Nocardioides sp. Soil805]|uniref:hypothetical protein n=1 Tax=Nocardioides sp. Soil805 TaxID=1736416 RepID=UPI0007036B61|nr:hypothetical protein [Nocardioides sp. Soil805]KRF36072.1 hypothetical protein ASG94_00835 [Nocardioides sp. Soil805]